MNDLDQLRQLRAEILYPERSRLAPGRSRLLAEGMRTPRQRFARGRRSHFLLPAAAAGAAVAVAIAGYGLATGSPPAAVPAVSKAAPPAPPAPSAPPAPPAVVAPAAGPQQATLAVRTLRAASAAIGRAPVTREPGPGQWIYSRTVQYEYPQGTSSDEEWITFDGGKSAYHQDGQLVVHTSPGTPPNAPKGNPLAAFYANTTPKTAYDALASLPGNPRALLAVVDRAAAAIGAENLAAGTPLAGSPPQTRSQLEFDYLAFLLWNAAAGVGAPAKAEAAAFRAMATLPGVTVQLGIRDAAGAPAVAVSGDGYDQLLLDPVSYQVIGLRQLSTGIGPQAAAPDPKSPAKLPKAERQPSWPRKGAVIGSLAYAQVSEVSGPGLR